MSLNKDRGSGTPSAVNSCKLCHKKDPLRKSHIIPEWSYGSLYDEIHRYHVLEAAPSRTQRLHQKGIYERLLCQRCETELSKYENYARAVFSGGPVNVKVAQHPIGLQLLGLDYSKFKLFELSVLWRAGAARHEFFSEVDLGSHQEVLRKMLVNRDPGKYREYGCILIPLVIDGAHLLDFIVQPVAAARGDSMRYRFVFGGYVWFYILGETDSEVAKLFVQRSGRMLIPRADSKVASYFQQLALKFGRNDG